MHKVVDPWGGSAYVEGLTNELVTKAWQHIQEVEELGGMARAIEQGIPKMRIEQAAAEQRLGDGLAFVVIDLRISRRETRSLSQRNRTRARKRSSARSRRSARSTRERSTGGGAACPSVG